MVRSSRDDDIIYQSDNQAEHRQIAESLLSKGLHINVITIKNIKQFSNSKKFHSEWRDKQSQIPPNKDFVFGLSPLKTTII